MTGLLALIGGAEHTPGCEPIDQALLEATGRSAPRVVLVPAAASPRRHGETVELARRYWSRLGARFAVALTSSPEDVDHALDALADADLVVLSGGHPARLCASLAGSPVRNRIVERWRNGAVLAGSSAGAMALCEWNLRLRPPNPLTLAPGLGVVGGCLVVPHFNRYGLPRWAGRAINRLPRLTVLGVDERTALIGRDGRFGVVGQGSVTSFCDGASVKHLRGGELVLPPAAGDVGR